MRHLKAAAGRIRACRLQPEVRLPQDSAHHSHLPVWIWHAAWSLRCLKSGRVSVKGIRTPVRVAPLHAELSLDHWSECSVNVCQAFVGNLGPLSCADDTTLMAESEEELKSLLMKVKVESETVVLSQVSHTLAACSSRGSKASFSLQEARLPCLL